MRKRILYTLAIICLAASCKTPKKAMTEPAAMPDLMADESSRKPIKDKGLFIATTELVPLDTAYIERNILHIFTKKILGCETEDFKLIWNGASKPSVPPQTHLKLFQKVDAACQERHQFHLTYNIALLHLKQDTAGTLISLGGLREILRYGP